MDEGKGKDSKKYRKVCGYIFNSMLFVPILTVKNMKTFKIFS